MHFSLLSTDSSFSFQKKKISLKKIFFENFYIFKNNLTCAEAAKVQWYYTNFNVKYVVLASYQLKIGLEPHTWTIGNP
jgi:hypothetical protein